MAMLLGEENYEEHALIKISEFITETLKNENGIVFVDLSFKHIESKDNDGLSFMFTPAEKPFILSAL